LAERLKPIPFEAIYSSPLKRALETARLISESFGLEPILDERLVELDYGQWEGKTLAEVMKNDPKTFQAWQADPAPVAPPGGESGLEAQQRVVSFLDSLAARHPQGQVLVVFHKTVCRLAICHALAMSPSEYRRRLIVNNAALSIIQAPPYGWQLITFNDTSHLSDQGLGARD
jgi:broad specificity phosphatase PhoE